MGRRNNILPGSDSIAGTEHLNFSTSLLSSLQANNIIGLKLDVFYCVENYTKLVVNSLLRAVRLRIQGMDCFHT